MELSKNAQTIIDLVREMNAVDLNQLVKAMEEEFGVSAAATVVAAWAPVIKVVKELLGLWLKEAKDLVEKAPCIIKENAKDDEIEAFKAKLAEAGATVTVK